MKVAEFLPQHAVLAEGLHSGRGLSQVYNVAGVRQPKDDGALGVKRQVIK